MIALVRELRTGAGDERPLMVAGVPALVPALARELRRGGDGAAVREGGDPRDAAALVIVLEGDPSDEQLALMRRATRADVPVIAVTEAGQEALPYVLATDIARVLPGAGFPLDEIADAIARRLGESGCALASRLPSIRGAVSRQLIRQFSRRNALAVLVPGVDLPLLTLNQARLVLRLAQAHGQEVSVERLPELLAVVGGAYGFRTVARELLTLVPVAGWALRGGVAYSGTLAVGEAALRYFEAGAPLSR